MSAGPALGRPRRSVYGRKRTMIALMNKPQALLVERGRVMCPLHGDADVERCFGCRWLCSARFEVAQPAITCEAIRPPDLAPYLR